MLHSMKNHIFIVVLCLLLVTVASTTGLLLHSYTSALETQAYQQNEQALEQLSYYLNSYTEEIYNLTLIPYYYHNILELLKTKEPLTPREKLEKRRAIESFLDSALLLPRQDILQVYILADNAYRSTNYESLGPSYEKQIESDWYKEVMEKRELTVLLAGEDGSRNSNYFSVVNVIRDLINNERILGVIKVDATYNTLEKVCSNINLGTEGGISIRTEDGQIVYSSMAEEDGNLDGKIVCSYPLDNFGWTIYAVNSLDDLHRLSARARSAAMWISLVMIALVGLALLYLVAEVFRPMNRVIHLMEEVRAGDEKLRYRENRKDEIGYLGATLNDMLDRLDAMMHDTMALQERIYSAKISQRDIMLRMLYGQVQPHFIYNTLNTVTILIRRGEAERAVELINRLSGLLRGIAYINKDIPLHKELKLIEAYLAIHEVRFANCFSYQLNIEKECEDIIVPALILQPIVKNAVVHGRNESEDPVWVSVTAEMERDHLAVTIEDDGDGIEENRLAELQERLQDCERREDIDISDRDIKEYGGLGLVNVYMRLKLRYGEEGDLTINSEKGKGTVVRMIIPRSGDTQKLEKEKRHDKCNGC